MIAPFELARECHKQGELDDWRASKQPYDLHFKVFSIHVRVTWLFWVVAAAFGYNMAVAFDNDALFPGQSPGAAVLLLIWVASVFLSILVHELGHSLAMRYYNIDSHIVLYHLGGLAIPATFRRVDRRAPGRNGFGPQAQLIISFAGPVFQMLLALVVMLFALSFGYNFPFSTWIAPLFMVDPSELTFPTDASLFMLIHSLIYPSIMWALLNLLPVLPLDGGRIAQHALSIFHKRDATYEATVLSIVVAALAALWGFQRQETYMGLMFAVLAFSNFQNLQGGIRGF